MHDCFSCEEKQILRRMEFSFKNKNMNIQYATNSESETFRATQS